MYSCEVLPSEPSVEVLSEIFTSLLLSLFPPVGRPLPLFLPF